MKGLKKILTGILAGAMALSMTLSAGSAMKAEAAGNTITVQNAVKGETYNIYRILDLDVANNDNPDKDNAYMYTINSTWEGFWTSGAGKDYIKTNNVGTKKYVNWVSGKETAAEMEAFGKAAAKYATDNNITPSATAITVGEDGVAKWEGLDNGYYMVSSTLGTAVSVASTPAHKDNVIKEKNETSTVEKKVKEDSANQYGESNDGAIGDEVSFRTKIQIAKNSTKVVYHDTMTSGLTWTGAANVKAYSDEAMSSAIDASNYAVAAGTGSETFTVTFTQAYLDSLKNAKTDVYIAYTAKINNSAQVGTIETNTPVLKWGDNGNAEGTPTKTVIHEFQILKYNGADTSKSPLAGAKFKIYLAETGDDALALAKSTDGLTYRVLNAGEKIPDGYTAADVIETVATGTIKVVGVDSDKYYLEETEAPAGFNKIQGRIEIQVAADNSLIKDVENLSGAVLPSTGGIGTTIFYIIGGLLIVAAVVFFVVRRKGDAE